jgi:hypothetical protein
MASTVSYSRVPLKPACARRGKRPLVAREH